MKDKIKELFKSRESKNMELSPEELVLREKIEKEFYFKAVIGIVASALFFVILFSIIFFVNVEGKEDTKVPNLEGLKLSEAIILLQERALYPKLSVKNSAPNEKGLIISQDISPGSVVKAGRLVGLTASLGGVIDKVGSYEGQTLDAVEAELRTLFSSSSSDPVLIIGTPIEVVSDEPAGTILSQDPAPDTEINEITELTFHVSKGKETSSYVVPTMKGLPFDEALKKITQWPIRYQFIVRKSKTDEEPGQVVAQNPERGVTTPWTTVLEMTMTIPEDYPADFTFGVLELVVPTYQVSIPMKLERVTITGDIEVIFESKTFGGALTIPYLEQVGTKLTVTVDDKEVKSFTVRQQ